MQITLNKKYQPLFKNNKDIRYIIISGSRGSGKSFASSLYTANYFRTAVKNSLYLRQFMSNVDISIIPQFIQQVSILNINSEFKIKRGEIQNKNGNKLYFKGFATSNSQADANLKSLTNLQMALVDEATEVKQQQFNKLNLSLRDKDANIKIILVLNPSYEQHWIFQRFFRKMNVQYNFNGVKDNVLYIHTTFLDNLDNLDESFLKQAQFVKNTDPIKYNNDFLGMWLRSNEKALLTKELLEIALQEYSVNDYQKVVLAIDPAVSVNKNSDNTGLAVCAKKGDHFFVLHCQQKKYTPNEWAIRASQLYQQYNCDYIVYQNNQGGLMVQSTLRTVLGNFCKIVDVRATKNKVLRFQPIHALYQKNLIHHKGRFTDLEYQLLTYSGNLKDSSPNSVDATVWGITALNQKKKSSIGFV